MISFSILPIHSSILYPIAEFGLEIPQTLSTFLLSHEIDFKLYQPVFNGKSKQTLFIPAGNLSIHLLGLGSKKKDYISISRHFFSQNDGAFDVHLGHLDNTGAEIIEGAILAEYNIKHLNTEIKEPKKVDLNILGKVDVAKLEEAFQIAETKKTIMTWMDLPANYKTPEMVAQWMYQGGSKYGFDVKIFDEIQCFDMGFHALLAVGKGSVESKPRMVEMHYKGKNAKLKIALVGKGVTFDTGGISLKPGDNMHYMKSDMGGAAAVFGALEMIAKLKLPIEVIGITPLTENCIDSLAVKPGDVINSYAGKTIEVINTDAEGRLILADAVSYAIQVHKPDTIIDLATLTGNSIAALGYAAGALFSSNDNLAHSIYNAGQLTEEKVWRMPLWDDYKDMMKSDVADIKNLSTAPFAGAITAAKFIEEFTSKHSSWAHIDIAGVAFGDADHSSMKSATGYGVKLLLQWVKSQID